MKRLEQVFHDNDELKVAITELLEKYEKGEFDKLDQVFNVEGSEHHEKKIGYWKEETKKRVFKKNELIFATPLKTRDAEEAVRERFVVFIPSRKADFHYGDAVKFNLLHCEDWRGQIAKEELEKLKLSLPSHWKKELGWIEKEDRDHCTDIQDIKNKNKFDAFNFKYLATTIEKLPEDFVLYPLYKFIEDLSDDTREDVLLKLAEIPHYGFKTIFPVDCTKGSHSISGINLMDSLLFATLRLSDEEMCFDQAYNDEDGVLEEITEYGQHKISSAEELPTRAKRKN